MLASFQIPNWTIVFPSSSVKDGPRQAAEFFTEEKATITAIDKVPIRKMGETTNTDAGK